MNVVVQDRSVVTSTPRFAAIRWGAILGGVVVGLSTQLVLALLGVAAGLSAVDVTERDIGVGNVSNAPMWTGIWQGVSMLIAAFVGGYVAARMSGLRRRSDGMLHGFVSWGATTLLFAVLSATAVGSLFGGVFNTITMATTQHTAGASTGISQPALQSLLKGTDNTTGQGTVTANTLRNLQQRIQAGDREGAVRYMVDDMGFSQDRASTIVDQALILSGSGDQASPQGRADAQRTVATAQMASWGLFSAVILSLLIGVGGGYAGSVGAERPVRTEV